MAFSRLLNWPKATISSALSRSIPSNDRMSAEPRAMQDAPALEKVFKSGAGVRPIVMHNGPSICAESRSTIWMC